MSRNLEPRAPTLSEVAEMLAEVQGQDFGQPVGGTTHKPLELQQLGDELREIDRDFAEGGAVAHAAHLRWGG